jgi:hypothetical protein
VTISGYKHAPWVLITCGLLIWPFATLVFDLTQRFHLVDSGILVYIFLFPLLAGLGFCAFAPFIARITLRAKFGIMFLAITVYLGIAWLCLTYIERYWSKS